MYNKVIVLGRLVADPEMRSTASGTRVASMTIAVPRRFAKPDSPVKADFFNVCAWTKQADYFAKYFKKGMQVLISGRLETRSWTDPATGGKKYATDIVAEEGYFADGKKIENEEYGDDDFSPVDISDPEALPF